MLDVDPSLVAEYAEYHQPGNVPQPIIDSIRESGVLNMRIYHFADRLIMIMDVADDFSFEAKSNSEAGNADVDAWETLMNKYQREISDPSGRQTGKWKRADQIFDLSLHK